MGITTKAGDAGITSLSSGERVRKDSLMVHLYGTLDELCSFLGFARSMMKCRKGRQLIESLQRDLFVVGAELCKAPRGCGTAALRIGADSVARLEQAIAQQEQKRVPAERCFCLPGGSVVSAALDVSRAVCRRAERLIVSLKRKKMLRNPCVLVYMNRLSDLLYLLSRSYDREQKKV